MKIFFLMLFCSAFIFTLACRSPENDTAAEDDSAQNILTADENPPETDTVEVQSFTEQHEAGFAGSRKNDFEVPDYDFIEKYDLVQVVDSDLPEGLFDKARLDGYNASVYLFTLENRVPGFQDFTLFITNDYSHNIVYCILDSDNKLVSALNIAYQLSEGEYSEYVSGSFISQNEYHQFINGVAEAWEEPDGTITEGSETESKRYFTIDKYGTITEI